MRLKDQRNAFDGGGVGALAALDQTLFEEFLRVGKPGDAQAGSAFAAEIVREAFAVGRLREHARESEFADATRAGKEQRVRNASAAEGAAEGRDKALVAEKFLKTHG
jgi:hypothetical protein